MNLKKKLVVSILVFDGVEELDFVGPLEVFGMASRISGGKGLHVLTIGQKMKPVRGAHGLKFLPNTSKLGKVRPDICVIPGGPGARKGVSDPKFIKWVEKCIKDVPLILSVCTGSLILAKMGLLDDARATTHRAALGKLKKLAPSCRVARNVRFVDSGRIVTAAGVSAGIDASLHILGRLFGKKIARETAKRMEYR